jgi:hypothetical protein
MERVGICHWCDGGARFGDERGVPRGWYMAGSKPAEYEAGMDAQMVRDGHASAYLKSKKANSAEGFGTLMQDFRAEQYLGKRIRWSGFVRAEGVDDWTGLWMRVDNGSAVVAFDNMQERPIKGTTGRQKYEVVLDVPEKATGIFLGVLLTGPGTVWLSGTKFEVVGLDVPVTSPETGQARRPGAPVNVDFQEQ